jgi:hypothetical protein
MEIVRACWAMYVLVGVGLIGCGPSPAHQALMQMDAEEAAAKAHKRFCANNSMPNKP